MPLLAKSELAVMFWAGGDPGETLQTYVDLGVRHGQMGVPGGLELDAAAWRAAASVLDFHIYTVFAAYEGESYADVAAVRDTVGLVPDATRSAREERTMEVIRWAHELGAAAVATHIGCVPADPDCNGYREVVGAVARICEEAAKFGLRFALETGQETAEELLHFIKVVNRPNLGINFDPANMILYGTGEPVEALKVLQHLVLSVHCKDGTWPVAAGALGTETPLGRGNVVWDRFLRQLEAGGYQGPLAIEREEHDEGQRLRDIEAGLKFLRALKLSGSERVT